MNRVQVKINMLPKYSALVPTKAHKTDAGYDVRSRINTVVGVGKTVLVPTGFRIQLPENYEAQIRPRSGLALKQEITINNSPGTVDCGFTAEVGVIIHNGGTEPFIIARKDRIAQMVICKLPVVELITVDELELTERGNTGFGDSGIK